MRSLYNLILAELLDAQFQIFTRYNTDQICIMVITSNCCFHRVEYHISLREQRHCYFIIACFQSVPLPSLSQTSHKNTLQNQLFVDGLGMKVSLPCSCWACPFPLSFFHGYDLPRICRRRHFFLLPTRSDWMEWIPASSSLRSAGVFQSHQTVQFHLCLWLILSFSLPDRSWSNRSCGRRGSVSE